jgi:4-amino-4-deoxy-L-arabinose transferase-like glycosyltransferase
MDEEKKISNIENNILNEEAVLKKEEKKIIPHNSSKDKVITWLKEPSNLALVAIMLFAFIIRIYYFWMTKNQPLWWDELCYGSIAKNFITHAWDGTILIVSEMNIRPLIFPLIWAFLMLFNISEVVSRFLLVFVPSMLSVFFIYLAAKEIFNKRIGLITAAIYSTIWINLFYSSRFLVHMMDLALLFASIYFFVKATKAEINFKHLAISLGLLSFATLTRYPDGIIFFVYFIIIILAKKLYLNKLKFWLAGIIGLSPLLLFFIINYFTRGNIFPALLGGTYLKPVQAGGQAAPFAFNILNYIPLFLQKILFVFFIIGLAYLLFELFLGYNLLVKNEKLRNILLLVLIPLVFYAFFIFYLRGAEDRWLFETILSLVIISAAGLDIVFRYVQKYNKIIAIILVIGILFAGGYYQITYADPLIKQKKDSYTQMQQAFYWIKDNTPQNSIIIGYGIEPYAVYYADRQYDRLELYNSSNLSDSLAEYMVIHGFVPQLDYVNPYLQENQDKWKPINAFFLDVEKKQPIVIIYQRQEIINSSN